MPTDLLAGATSDRRGYTRFMGVQGGRLVLGIVAVTALAMHASTALASTSATPLQAVPKPVTAPAQVVSLGYCEEDGGFYQSGSSGGFRWAAVKGVTAYTVVFNDGAYGGAEQRITVAAEDDGSWPADRPPEGEKHPEWNAPSGTHQIGWTGGAGFGPGSCAGYEPPDYSERLTNAHVEYYLDGEYVMGTVRGPCVNGSCPPLQGVKVTAKGPGGGSATTGASGAYSIKVRKGTYEVKAQKGELEFSPESKTVKVGTNKVKTVNFKARNPELKFKAKVTTFDETGSLRRVPGEPVRGARVSITGADVDAVKFTGRDGTATFKLRTTGNFDVAASGGKAPGSDTPRYIGLTGPETLTEAHLAGSPGDTAKFQLAPVCENRYATIYGERQPAGTEGDDVIYGWGAIGNGGDDLVCGQGALGGGPGDDRLALVGCRKENLSAIRADRTVAGDAGSDRITGTRCDDLLYGYNSLPLEGSVIEDPGSDIIDAGGGDDAVAGGVGNDVVKGGDGDDSLSGDNITDTDGPGWYAGRTGVSTGLGTLPDDDRLLGGRGDDYIGGVDGVDFLDGGPDKDILIGGYAPESAVDTCVNGEVFSHKGFPDSEPSCGNRKRD